MQHRSTKPRESIGFPRRAFQGATAVGSFLPGLTNKALQKFGFSTAGLIVDWPAIVGRELAQSTAPERLRWPRVVERPHDDEASGSARRNGAVLILRVDGARALDVQYRAGQIIERINGYFGYAAVAQLRVIQAPTPAVQPKREHRARPQPLEREVAGITDARLRDALARLGAEIRTGR